MSHTIAPVSRLKKIDIVWLSCHKCKHRHTYLEHYPCYLEEHPNRERIGFFDTENSSLVADFGIMLCYCILDGQTGEILYRVITKEELEKDLDKQVVKACIEDLKKFDRIVTYYGARYDFPFVRTRAVVHGLPFPGYGEIIHEDIYFTVRNKFKLSRNRLENACRTLLGLTEKTHIEPVRWLKALRGDKKSIAWILDHCKRDVRDLKRVYDTVECFKKHTDTSA